MMHAAARFFISDLKSAVAKKVGSSDAKDQRAHAETID
jgi:hypothetical protein